MKTTRTRVALGAGLTAALLALTGCGGGGGSDAEESSSSSASPEADVEGVPEVVAEVNGEEITRDEFTLVYRAQLQQAEAQAQTTGQAPDEDALKQQTAQGLVDTELLRQEAGERGIEASDDAVERELASVAQENQLGSVQALLDALEEQGTSEEQARGQAQTQLLVEGLVADEAGGEIEPTERELRTLYRQVKEQQAQAGEQAGQEIPPFADVRAQLEEQAVSQEQGRIAQSLVEELTEDADISINL
ncbi:SurA N-terminal domain-containing protein [Nocardioides aequoreus]|uniref:SurA N-terminal domain-containing protein n=1 Tax=Nocardioides aequoreus TaxID=397278 RepID=UPI0004C2DD22|nr:SurA N-terminal domain-containing protein [Nocardioides aequoreus]